MASKHDIRRNNTRAGLFTVAGLVLAFVVLIVLNSSAMSYLFNAQNEYVVVFTLDEGVTGVTEGSDVRLGGVVSGRVTDVTLQGMATPEGEQASPRIEVSIEIDAEIRLWSNAVAVRTPPVLGSQAWINISTIGGPDQETVAPTVANGAQAVKLSPEGGVLMATPGDGLLTTIIGSANASTTKSIIASIESFTAFLDSTVIDAFDGEVAPALGDARAIVGNVRRDYDGWAGDVTTTLHDASDSMKMITTLVRENRAHINEVLANADTMSQDGVAITHQLRTETMAKVDRALDLATDALDEVSTTLETVNVEVALALPTIRTFLQDALIAAGELKLATIEIRRSPWRMLYTPKPGELAHDNLFAAARSFTIAASDVRSAAESFQAVLDRFPGAIESDPSLRADIETYLADSLTRFQEAQERLFSVIVGED